MSEQNTSRKKSKCADGGEIFCIPLFLPKDDWKLTIKLSKEDYGKEFVFGRAIEDCKGCGILVEIFRKVGNLETDIDEIIGSGRLFEPIFIFWVGVRKRRWKVIGKTQDYDKWGKSNYKDINIVFGVHGDFRLHNFATMQETKLPTESIGKYEHSKIWFPIDLENRIIKELEKQGLITEIK